MIKSQLQQQHRQHQAYARAYGEFLQRHQRTMLELVLDDPQPLETWRLLRQEQQTQSKQHQQQQEQAADASAMEQEGAAADVPGAAAAAVGSASPSASAMEAEAYPSNSPQRSQEVSAGDQGTATATAPGAAAAAAGAATGGDAGGGLVRQPSGEGVGGSNSSLVSLTSTLGRASSLPPVMVSATELDRLGFLVQVVTGADATSSGSTSGGAVAAAGGGGSGGEGAQPSTSSSSGGVEQRQQQQQVPLSGAMPGLREGAGAASLEEVMVWMSHSWQHVAAPGILGSSSGGFGGMGPSGGVGSRLAAAVALEGGPGGAGGSGGGGGGSPWLSGSGGGVVPASPGGSSGGGATPTHAGITAAAGAAAVAGVDRDKGEVGSSSPVPGVAAAAGGATPQSPVFHAANGHLQQQLLQPQTQQQQQQMQGFLMNPSLSPVRTHISPGSSGGGSAGQHGLGSSMRINTVRGTVSVALGVVDEHQIQGVYRGSVLRGPRDVEQMGDLLIQDCTEAHIYVLAPLR